MILVFFTKDCCYDISTFVVPRTKVLYDVVYSKLQCDLTFLTVSDSSVSDALNKKL
jgi:hypothetical protein